MKSNLIRIAGALAVLVCIFLAFSCGEAPKNTQVSNEQANASAVTRASCTPSGNETKIGFLKRRIREEMPDDVKGQYDARKFDFEIRPFSTSGRLEMLIRGKVFGMGKQGSTLEDLFDSFDGFRKGACIERVIIVAGTPGTPWPEAAAMTVGSFEWSLCESPDVYCEDGVCRPSCNGGTGNTANNAPMNGNTGNKANTGQNTNAGNGGG